MSTNIQNSWIGGLVAALAASLCCITPLLAIFGGISGTATNFNWIEPFRPYIIGLTILIFVVAWYQQLVVVPRGQEDCCEPIKRSFWKSKKFLLVLTLFSGVVIAFPYYSSFFYRTTPPIATISHQGKFKFVKLNIKGMGCADCTKHIDRALMGINGVSTSNTSYEKAETIVGYDPTKTNADSINLKIKEIGYQSTLIKNN